MIKTNSRDLTGDDSDVESPSAPSEIQLPETGIDSLVGHFFASGQILQSGTGLVPLTWQELQAYTELNDLDLCSWELKIIKRMSEAYCTEYAKASSPNHPAPYVKHVEPEEVDQIAKAQRIKQGLSAFRKRKG